MPTRRTLKCPSRSSSRAAAPPWPGSTTDASLASPTDWGRCCMGAATSIRHAREAPSAAPSGAPARTSPVRGIPAALVWAIFANPGPIVMNDELPTLLDQARRLAVSLEGTVPEVRCLAATLDTLASADGGPAIDLFLPAPELAQRAEKVAAGLGWKPRRRELGDGEVRELTALPAAIWVCTPEVREQVAALE